MERATRTTSLARSIIWSIWWRLLSSYLCFNFVLFVTILISFNFQCAKRAEAEHLPEGRIAIQQAKYPLDWVGYKIELPNTEVVWYSLSDPVFGITPLVLVVAGGEILSLLNLPLSTRRVRRKLQPLNELALAAEELGNAASMSTHKMHNLEQAIHSATVDSPHVATGDKDLRSIEVALNGLLRQMQEAKLQQMRFVSDASHELRTPISVIQGYVNMIDRWGKQDEVVLDESIQALKAESAHMQELVEQLLFLARGDSGRQSLQHDPYNLADTIEEAWEESRMIDEEHYYAFKLVGDDRTNPAFELAGDGAMIKQVARILVQNAVVYAPEGTQISLAVYPEEAGACFSVQDEGIGISAKDIPHVFERFYRADNARDRREGGTGLGLSIAAWIVEAHGGSIEVLSREGVGTRFSVHLPRR